MLIVPTELFQYRASTPSPLGVTLSPMSTVATAGAPRLYAAVSVMETITASGDSTAASASGVTVTVAVFTPIGSVTVPVSAV